jgi:hypothetical protein
MAPRSVAGVAATLCDLYSSEFGDRKSGAYRMPTEKFREFTGRKRLEATVIREIATLLAHRYKLILVQGSDFVAVLGERQLTRLRVVDNSIISKAREL